MPMADGKEPNNMKDSTGPTLIDHIFQKIDEFHGLAEIEQFAEQELSRRHINAVAVYRDETGVPRTHTVDDTEYRDSAEWVATPEFYRHLIQHPQCPDWLSREIVWKMLRSPTIH